MCEFCQNHEQGDTLYEPSDWDGGIGFDYIRDIKYCPLCGRKLDSDLTFDKVMEEIQTQVIEFPDTHQKFIFTRQIEMDGDSIKIGDWEYKGVKDEEKEGE